MSITKRVKKVIHLLVMYATKSTRVDEGKQRVYETEEYRKIYRA